MIQPPPHICSTMAALLATSVLIQAHGPAHAQEATPPISVPSQRSEAQQIGQPPSQDRVSRDAADDTDATPDESLEDPGGDAGGQPDKRIFRDQDGNPLPPDVQEQLRKALSDNPGAVTTTVRRLPEQDGDIVVRGERERGAVLGDIPVERSFSQTDLRAYGAATIGDLIDALGPQVASGSGGDPVTLLNGRRVSSFGEIARIPSEAIERLDVFPEELALQYGHRADQKVVNVVTFETFDSQFGQISAFVPTAGGFANGRIEADHFQIDGDTRFSLAANYVVSSALLEEERDLIAPQAFRTLIPEDERFELRGLVSRPLGGAISATVNARYGESDSRSLLGLNPSADSERVLRRDSERQELSVGTTLNGRVDRWVWTITGGYERVRSESRTNVAGGSGQRNEADSVSSVLETNLMLNGPLIPLPAGDVTASINAGYGTRDFKARSLRGVMPLETDLGRREGGGQITLDVPILRETSPIGRLSAYGHFGFETLSDTSDLDRHGYGLVWSPSEAVSFIGSLTREEAAPSLLQLGGPILETPNVRTFDFARGEAVEVTRISGGNPQLASEDEEVVRLGLHVRPIPDTDLTLSIDYSSMRTDDPIASFPVLLPEVEAAFPDRFVRDGAGQLMQVDARPVNFARVEQERLRWGVNFTQPLGPGLPGAPKGGGRTFGSLEEAQRAFPNATVIVAEPGSALARRAENTRSRVFVSLYHDWYLEEEVLLADGLSPLDLLDGDAIEFTGGRRRHQVELQGGVYKGGLGARVDVTYRSGSEVSGGLQGALQFEDLTTVNVNLFADLPGLVGESRSPDWLRGARLSLGMTNLFNARQQVRDAQGATPISYQPAYLDPLGRTVTLSLRKVF